MRIVQGRKVDKCSECVCFIGFVDYHCLAVQEGYCGGEDINPSCPFDEYEEVTRK